MCIYRLNRTELIVQAMRNKAFEMNIPLMDTSLAKVLEVAKSFSNNLFEFFVSVTDCLCFVVL